jgi:hypothetical protein
MDYTTLSLAELRTALDDVARDAQVTFGGLDARQLNWRPDATRWSVAQCFEHLLAANGLMLQASADALNPASPRTFWQRAPFLPGVFGRLLIRSQTPESTRKYTAAPKATPTASDITADVVQRFVIQNGEIMKRLQALDQAVAGRAIMTSPFVNVITYSVLDGWRLVFAHDRRHIEQARRVTQSPGYPAR